MNNFERKQKIIDFIRAYGSITSAEAQSVTGAHRNTVYSDFLAMLRNEILVANGKGKGARYYLFESNIFPDKIVQSIFKTREKTALDNYFKNTKRSKVFFNKTMSKALNADFSNSGDITDAITLMHSQLQEKRKLLSEIERKRKKEKLTIDLSWASANIEGNTYSILETETLIKYNETSKGKSIEEAQMILNHKDAIEYIRSSISYYKKINKKKIFELHQLLTNNLAVPTGFRKQLVSISNSSFVPCDNEFQIASFFDDMLAKINTISSPLEKAIAANLLVAYLQPFLDGNKRTSRMLGNAILLSHELLPVSFAHTPKEDYIKGVLYFYEKQNPNYFKQLFLHELNCSFREYIG